MADATPLAARWVKLLLEPSSRKQALLEISAMEPGSSEVALVLWGAFGAVASLVKELLAVAPIAEGRVASESAMDSTALTLQVLLHLLINDRTRWHFANSGVVDVVLPLLQLDSLHGPRTVGVKIAALSMVAYTLMSMDDDSQATSTYSSNADDACFLCAGAFLPAILNQMNHVNVDIKHLCASILYLILNSTNMKVKDTLTEAEEKRVCHAISRSILQISRIQESTASDCPAATRCLLSLLGCIKLLLHRVTAHQELNSICPLMALLMDPYKHIPAHLLSTATISALLCDIQATLISIPTCGTKQDMQQQPASSSEPAQSQFKSTSPSSTSPSFDETQCGLQTGDRALSTPCAIVSACVDAQDCRPYVLPYSPSALPTPTSPASTDDASASHDCIEAKVHPSGMRCTQGPLRLPGQTSQCDFQNLPNFLEPECATRSEMAVCIRAATPGHTQCAFIPMSPRMEARRQAATPIPVSPSTSSPYTSVARQLSLMLPPHLHSPDTDDSTCRPSLLPSGHSRCHGKEFGSLYQYMNFAAQPHHDVNADSRGQHYLQDDQFVMMPPASPGSLPGHSDKPGRIALVELDARWLATPPKSALNESEDVVSDQVDHRLSTHDVLGVFATVECSNQPQNSHGSPRVDQKISKVDRGKSDAKASQAALHAPPCTGSTLSARLGPCMSTPDKLLQSHDGSVNIRNNSENPEGVVHDRLPTVRPQLLDGMQEGTAVVAFSDRLTEEFDDTRDAARGLHPGALVCSVSHVSTNPAEHTKFDFGRQEDAPGSSFFLDEKFRTLQLCGLTQAGDAPMIRQHDGMLPRLPVNRPVYHRQYSRQNMSTGDLDKHSTEKASRSQQKKGLSRVASSDQQMPVRQQRHGKSSTRRLKKASLEPAKEAEGQPLLRKASKARKLERANSRRNRARAGHDSALAKGSERCGQEKDTAMTGSDLLNARALWEEQFPTLSSSCGRHSNCLKQRGGPANESCRQGCSNNFASAAKASARSRNAIAHLCGGQHLENGYNALRHEVMLKRETCGKKLHMPSPGENTDNCIAARMKHRLRESCHLESVEHKEELSTGVERNKTGPGSQKGQQDLCSCESRAVGTCREVDTAGPCKGTSGLKSTLDEQENMHPDAAANAAATVGYRPQSERENRNVIALSDDLVVHSLAQVLNTGGVMNTGCLGAAGSTMKHLFSHRSAQKVVSQDDREQGSEITVNAQAVPLTLDVSPSRQQELFLVENKSRMRACSSQGPFDIRSNSTVQANPIMASSPGGDSTCRLHAEDLQHDRIETKPERLCTGQVTYSTMRDSPIGHCLPPQNGLSQINWANASSGIDSGSTSAAVTYRSESQQLTSVQPPPSLSKKTMHEQGHQLILDVDEVKPRQQPDINCLLYHCDSDFAGSDHVSATACANDGYVEVRRKEPGNRSLSVSCIEPQAESHAQRCASRTGATSAHLPGVAVAARHARPSKADCQFAGHASTCSSRKHPPRPLKQRMEPPGHAGAHPSLSACLGGAIALSAQSLPPCEAKTSQISAQHIQQREHVTARTTPMHKQNHHFLFGQWPCPPPPRAGPLAPCSSHSRMARPPPRPFPMHPPTLTSGIPVSMSGQCHPVHPWLGVWPPAGSLGPGAAGGPWLPYVPPSCAMVGTMYGLMPPQRPPMPQTTRQKQGGILANRR